MLDDSFDRALAGLHNSIVTKTRTMAQLRILFDTTIPRGGGSVADARGVVHLVTGWNVLHDTATADDLYLSVSLPETPILVFNADGQPGPAFRSSCARSDARAGGAGSDGKLKDEGRHIGDAERRILDARLFRLCGHRFASRHVLNAAAYRCATSLRQHIAGLALSWPPGAVEIFAERVWMWTWLLNARLETPTARHECWACTLPANFCTCRAT